MTRETLCICGHFNRQHNMMNQKAWDRFHTQVNGYNDSEGARLKFWTKYLANGTDDEWKCTQCDCEAFKMDNLKYLEEKYKEKKCRLK